MKTETFFGCLPETISPVLFPWLNPNFILLTFPPLHRPFNFSSVPLLSRIHSLRPYGLQHARLPCPSPTPSACSNSCPLSRWCHPTTSSCRPLLLLSSIFPNIRVLSNESVLFASGGQSIGVSASAAVLAKNIQDWFPLGWTGWISLLSKGLSRVFSNTTVQERQVFGTQLSLWSNSHIHSFDKMDLSL